jgi:hypothetical protein
MAPEYEAYRGGVLGVCRPAGWPPVKTVCAVLAALAGVMWGFGTSGLDVLVRFAMGVTVVLAAVEADYEDLTLKWGGPLVIRRN